MEAEETHMSWHSNLKSVSLYNIWMKRSVGYFVLQPEISMIWVKWITLFLLVLNTFRLKKPIILTSVLTTNAAGSRAQLWGQGRVSVTRHRIGAQHRPAPWVAIHAHFSFWNGRSTLIFPSWWWKQQQKNVLSEKSAATNRSTPSHTDTQSATYTCDACGRDCHFRIGLFSHRRRC